MEEGTCHAYQLRPALSREGRCDKESAFATENLELNVDQSDDLGRGQGKQSDVNFRAIVALKPGSLAK